MNEKVLVCGAAGFIGRHVVDLLLKEGQYEVIGCDTLVETVHGRIKIRPEFPVPLIAANASMCPLHEYDSIIYLGARVGVGQATLEPEKYVKSNVMDLAYTWQHIKDLPVDKRPKKFIVASSCSVYGGKEYGHRAKESEPVNLSNLYAATKYDQEIHSLLLGDAYGVSTVALRFFNVIGAGQSLSNPYTGVAAMFAARILNGKGGLVYEDGLQTRDFISVEDVSRGVLLALEQAGECAGEVFNLCTGERTPLLQLHQCLAASLNVASIEPVVTGIKRSGDYRHLVGCPEKTEHVLGFKAKSNFTDTIEEYAAWLKEQDMTQVNERVEEVWEEMKKAGLQK
jgi:dTDP-L-rhamnose 4-epimerase